MANNPYVNKVQYGNDVLIDLSSDTVAADKILSGYTAHNKAGATITGTIPSKNSTDLTHSTRAESTRVYLETNVPVGYYPSGATAGTSVVYMPVPSSGTVGFTVYIPNGTTTPDQSVAADWIPLEIEVDSNGNSNVVDDTIAASGVSF